MMIELGGWPRHFT